MKLLITGSKGFLGKHVVKEFEKYSNINVIGYSSKEFDLTNLDQTEACFKSAQPDVVVHMAALCGGLLFNKNNPAELIRINTIMGTNVFDCTMKYGIKKIYTLGSVCAYPKFCPTPFKEDNIWQGYPEETNAPYGLTKRHLLTLGNAYRDQYGIGGAHLIPVNLYGPGDEFNPEKSHVIPALIRKFVEAVASGASQVQCWGSGECTREFLYAGDAAMGIANAVSQGLDTALPINLGTGSEISIKHLAQAIAGLTGFHGEIVFNGTVGDGQPKRMLDVSRAKELMNFTAKTNLLQGLYETVQWYKVNQ